MPDPHPINQTLLTLQANQQRRVYHAFAGLTDAVFTADPGGGCNSIQAIGEHVLELHQFMLMLLGSELQAQVNRDASSPAAIMPALKHAGELLRQGIEAHDPDGWTAVPDAPRQGPWGDEPTLDRVSRPFNDLTNHLGAVRAIRRQLGNPAAGTQEAYA